MKFYSIPDISILYCVAEDVLTVSGDPGPGDWLGDDPGLFE